MARLNFAVTEIREPSRSNVGHWLAGLAIAAMAFGPTLAFLT
jgi:hypothetical protein